MSSSATHSQRVRLGVSACLLGQAVRYDGGHKRDLFLTDLPEPVRRLGTGVPRRGGWFRDPAGIHAPRAPQR